MNLINVFKTRKVLLLNIFFTLYIGTNLIGGERGLISYFEKKNYASSLSQKYINLTQDVKVLENKNRLLSANVDLDYLDKLYREKLKFGKKDEILIKLK
mgnify:CR=1 FL=1